MKIKFDKSSLEIGSRNAITGQIAIESASNEFFPDENWNDSVVILLSTWLKNVIEIPEGNAVQSRFYFFDGPFSFEILENKNLSHVKLYGNNQHISTINEDKLNFKDELLKCCNELVFELDKRRWETKETIELKGLLNNLVGVIK